MIKTIAICFLLACIAGLPEAGLADRVFEGTDFGWDWELEECIEVTAGGMSISCPPAIEFAIGCYARIGDALYNIPTGIKVEVQHDGYAWLGIFDNCGRVYEYQPQSNYGYASSQVSFNCLGRNDRAGQNYPWAEGPQTWAFAIENYYGNEGQPIRRLTTTTPDGQNYVHEITMPTFYELLGEISIYFGAGRGHTTTITRVELIGENVVGTTSETWGAVKSLFR